MTKAFRALFPGAAVLFAALAFLAFATEAMVHDVASTYGLVVYGAGLALAWAFHRSRTFIALLIIAWIDITVVDGPDGTATIVALGTVVLGLFGALGLMRDRGVTSSVALAQSVAIAAVVGLTAVVFSDPVRVAEFSARPEILPLEMLVWPGYPRVTLVVAALAFLSVAYGFHRYRGAVERSFIWCLILMLVAMHPEVGTAGSALFLMATGLTLTVGVVETSYAMAYRDDLTGLPGRRALMQYLDGIKGTYTIAMIDIDHFKRFNDRHGHDVGDQVLRLVAARIGGATGGGKAYRYGGEEFTLIYPGRTVLDARPHVEALRKAVDESRFLVRSWKRPRVKPGSEVRSAKVAKNKELTVTVSAGLADSSGAGAVDAETVLKKADEALYRAKSKGRNRLDP